MSAIAKRDGRGRLLPGASLNPGGRPATLEPVRALLRPHNEAFVTGLIGLLRSESEEIRLAACREFFDRLCGKPVQATDATVQTLDIGQLYVEALRLANAPPTTDATPAQATAATTLPPIEADDGHHEW